MEIREETGLVIRTYTDDVFQFSYVTLLTQSQVVAVKLSRPIQQSKFAHVLHPEYIVTIELVKTRKNWILRQVLSAQRVRKDRSYMGKMSVSQMMKLVNDQITDQQELSIYDWILSLLQGDCADMRLHEFEEELKKRINFKTLS